MQNLNEFSLCSKWCVSELCSETSVSHNWRMAKIQASYLSCSPPILFAVPLVRVFVLNGSPVLRKPELTSLQLWPEHCPAQHVVLPVLSPTCSALKIPSSQQVTSFQLMGVALCAPVCLPKRHCVCVCSGSFRPCLWKAVHSRTSELRDGIRTTTVFRCR